MFFGVTELLPLVSYVYVSRKFEEIINRDRNNRGAAAAVAPAEVGDRPPDEAENLLPR
jgi:hypothetical protein